jgi:hypothetical protein
VWLGEEIYIPMDAPNLRSCFFAVPMRITSERDFPDPVPVSFSLSGARARDNDHHSPDSYHFFQGFRQKPILRNNKKEYVFMCKSGIIKYTG